MNIVFDLGGVVFTWEPRAIIAQVFTDPDLQAKVRSEVFEHPDWHELDRGVLPRQEAILRAAERTGLAVSAIAELMYSVPLSLIPIPGTVELLYRLKAKGPRLFCLSNMHVASIAHLESTYPLWDVFEGVVISCRLHMAKPEPEIYRYLLEKYRLEVAETVFVDDMEKNLNAAAQFGIRTIKFENPEQCERQLHMLDCI